MRKNIKNYTTTAKVEKTLAEIQAILAAKGAEKIMIDYAGGVPVGLAFQIKTERGLMSVSLPARIENVKKLLIRSAAPAIQRNADKIAWRNIKDWIDAQIALIEASMVKTEEVFLPYMIAGGQTLFERFESGNLLKGGDVK